jgi:exosortase E/protease (VPEID-CTERM system)
LKTKHLKPCYFLARLYIFFVVVALEYGYCFTGRGTIPGHLTILGMTTDGYGQIPLFAFVVFLGFGHFRLKRLKEELPFGGLFFLAHLVLIAAVLTLTLASRQDLSWSQFDTFGYAKSALYLLATILLAFACVPLRSWIGGMRATGYLWLYSLLAGIAGWAFGTPVRLLWKVTSTAQSGWMQRDTLYAVSAVVQRFNPNIVSDPSTFMIGTPNFSMIIAPGCSGVEGLGLVLVFTSLWLWVYRKETRFPQALLLIPVALGCSWLLNIVRLCALVSIACAGAPQAVTAGFHAQFGWIAFTLIALFFSLATQRLSWFRKLPADFDSTEETRGGLGSPSVQTKSPSESSGESPAVRAYLIPLLGILAAASVSKLTSAYFDWMYPLRFIVAVLALWFFWPELKKLNWRFGWLGPLAGAAVFLMWIAPSWYASLMGHPQATGSLGSDLAALSPASRWAWIAFRVAAAVITVPIAEELAFRGYLARRLMSREFDQVSFSTLSAVAIGLSSLVFGVEHMKNLMDWQHLLLGTVAGLAFAGVLRWRGRIGDAVVAHAVSNLLLAVWVLGLGDWSQW